MNEYIFYFLYRYIFLELEFPYQLLSHKEYKSLVAALG